MITISIEELHTRDLRSQSAFERIVTERLKRIEAALGIGDQAPAHKQGRTHPTPQTEGSARDTAKTTGVLDRAAQDLELRHAHRKIIEVLASQTDCATGRYGEIHFSRLVREARVGKNATRVYLDLLIRKGYVDQRSDGYRTFFRLKG